MDSPDKTTEGNTVDAWLDDGGEADFNLDFAGDADAGDAEGLEEDSAEGKKKKEKPKKDANAFTSSIERNVWSHRNAIWRKYAVEMPP